MKINRCWFFSVLAAFPGCGHPTTKAVIDATSPKILDVIDGESFMIGPKDSPRKVRIEGIDAPEPGQAFEGASKGALAVRLLGSVVRIVPSATLPDGTTIARVFEGDVDIGREMVSRGWAWKSEDSKRDDLAAAQAQARTGHRGLWSDPCAIPPWEWRQGWRPKK
jgi:micrococcal nuclease